VGWDSSDTRAARTPPRTTAPRGTPYSLCLCVVQVVYTDNDMSTLTEAKVVVSAQIARNQREELERRAAENDRTISWYVRQAVERYLERTDITDEGETR